MKTSGQAYQTVTEKKFYVFAYVFRVLSDWQMYVSRKIRNKAG